MNIRRSAFIVAVSVASLVGAAEPGIELAGVLTAGGKVRLALTDTEKKVTTWVEPGDEFKGYTVARYDQKEEAVFLKKGAQETRIGLLAPKTTDPTAVNTVTTNAAPAAATATAIRANLRQLATAARQYQLAHNATSVHYADIVGPDKMIKEIKPVAGENYSTLSFGPNVTGVSVTTANGVTIAMELPSAGAAASSPHGAATAPGSIAAAPTSVAIEAVAPTGRDSVPAAYTTRAGDTWQKVSEASGIPVNQLKELNPLLAHATSLPPGQALRTR